MLQILHSTSYTGIIGAFFAASAFLLQGYLWYNRRNCPPGPHGDPIIGNVRRMPKSFAWIYYSQLKEKYGDLVYIQVLRQRILLLGSYEVAHQLLSKRGADYSERYWFPLINETVRPNPPFSPIGPKWREERRLYRVHLGKDAIQSHLRTALESQAHDYVLQAVNAGNTSSSQYITALIKTLLQTTYGIKPKSNDDDLVHRLEKGAELGDETVMPGVHWVNLIPGLPTLRTWSQFLISRILQKEGHLDIWRGYMNRLITEPYHIAKNEDIKGLGKQSFVASMLHDNTSLTEEQIMFLAGSTFVAGGDTTNGTVQHFLHHMLLYPDVQKKAQEEIDRVVGRDRLPTLDDMSRLPYIDALFKEIVRHRPVVPFSLPHAATKQDVYNGYVIPQGTMIVQNTWAMAMDKTIYCEPEKFTPERWLAENPPLDPRLYAFGVGRRICPGMVYGENVVLTIMLTVLATVDVAKAIDNKGQEIPVDPGTTGKFLNVPIPFEFQYIPRSEASLALLRHAVDAAA